MPVTFSVAKQAANPIKQSTSKPTLDGFLKGCASEDTKSCHEILQTSFTVDRLPNLRPMSNGFVHTIIEAYNKHHHLIIRPDDVWMAILSQFSLYVNAHSEELRSKFVAHEGKKELIVRRTGDRYSVDFGEMAMEMTTHLHANVVDKDLQTWILPQFSTTTPIDTTIYAIQMMATLKAYFNYTMLLDCGIPSVTLLGEKADWEALLERIPKLTTFGTEPAKWADILMPILSRFVEAFDGNPDVEFWGRVAHYANMGSGPVWLSGWITAFCPWDKDGKWMVGISHNRAISSKLKLPTKSKRGISVLSNSQFPMQGREFTLVIDGQMYHSIDSDEVPRGYCEVPVKLLDNGVEFKTKMIAGHMALESTALTKDGEVNAVKPAPGWFMFTEDGGTVAIPDKRRESVERVEHMDTGEIKGTERIIEKLRRILRRTVCFRS